MEIPKLVSIKKIIQETPEVRTYILDYSVGAKPGQFVNLWIPRFDEKPFSVSYDDGKEMWLTIFLRGPFTAKLAEKKEGEKIGVRGPYGTYFRFKEGDKLALIAGGYGAAPFYFLAVSALEKNCKIEFFVGARSQNQLLFLDRISELKENLNLHIATDDGSKGFKGNNVALFAKKITGGLIVDKVMACGPEMMLKNLSGFCAEKNIEAELSLERYMKCSFGICGQCALDPLGLMVCKDGPVFSNDICKQLTEFGNYHRDKNGQKIFFKQ